MKDYIDKLREDYHRKKISKFFFGGSKRVKANPPPSFIGDEEWGPINPNTNKNPVYTEPAENDWSGNYNYGALGLEKEPDNAITIDTKDRAAFEKVAPGVLSPEIKPIVTSNPPPSFIGDEDWGPIDPNANKEPTYTEPAENDWSGKNNYEALGLEKEPDDKITLTPEQKKEFDDNEKKFQKDYEKAKKRRLAEEQQDGKTESSNFFLPPHGDLTTNLYNLGRAIGLKRGTKGRGLAIAGNAGAAALEGARAMFSGVGFSKAQGYTDQFNQDQMIAARKKYESNPQYKNANYIGGATQARLGGKFGYFEEGGEQQMDPRMEQMMAQQQQADPRMQQQEETQMDPRMQQQEETQMNQQEVQAYQQIAEKLVNSFETIEEVADYLNENGVDEVAFNAIIKFAQDMIEDRDESADDNEEATEEPKEEEEMRKGGKKFNKKVGEYIEFEYDGKVHKGTIKSIKNGQIFLK